ncbi:hypothetical protein EIP86_002526 [Pleurotus ostreatoroseus]|nr:hypothetical protein EIP86_002526 [Pleurotus ostreatoroseus]
MEPVPEAHNIADSWLASFAAALSARNPEAVADVFLPNGWLRDILTFTWDNRSLEGKQKIIRYVADALPGLSFSEVKLSEDKHFLPTYVPLPSGQEVEFGYTFETSIAYGKGLVRLLENEQGVWKALIVSTILDDLKGHEESLGGTIINTHVSWSIVEEERRARIESNPHVLIVGAGQTGLNIAARFRQMNIPTLVIEQNQHVGDNWRQRYQSLTLHTIRHHHEMLYQRYPTTWPLFTPRDKMATALETYAMSHDLVVWTSSRIKGRPQYDSNSHKWTVTVDRDGTDALLFPSHIILSTGYWGGPYMPELPGKDEFKGNFLHSSQYKDPLAYHDMDVVVIGAGNSSIDICEDLALNGAKSVTMIQRSSTCVVSRENASKRQSQLWKPDVPTEVADFRFASTPLGYWKKLMMNMQTEQWARETELHTKLTKGGLKLNLGPEGQGQPLLVFERGGGYWIDKGGADLIASGKIKIKQGIEPNAFTSTGLKFTDGSELTVDAVIFATGYISMRVISKNLFGAEIIDRTCDIWGLDEEGELQGNFRPSGHPGLWYTAGDFFTSRFLSKHLAMHIKAMELGLQAVKA